jgi:hypothetical protein
MLVVSLLSTLLAAAPAPSCSAGSCPRGAPHAAPAAAAAVASKRMVVLTSHACAACARAAVAATAAERACPGAGVALVHESVDEPGGAAVARDHRAEVLPTFLFLDERGTELARLEGPQPAERLQRALGRLAGISCEGEFAPATLGG